MNVTFKFNLFSCLITFKLWRKHKKVRIKIAPTEL